MPARGRLPLLQRGHRHRIAIRTIFIRGREFFVQAGAGIVWDSVPRNELREIDSKLRVLSTALGGMA